ncbi:oligosaccharide flippase family protein [Pseudomaricurvus sp. HS19]|uniref:oligosaccharide flippase family protein n=1 Tax=Pseudomaricurvus sp. HS19 TaxID=2692626 RepID=UPI00136EFE39|nr:oligosaccharide flippase family protein [Pseudomaricurvus sp. HS19]MYM62039.1 oligosaccharide flippase family protein [Pseudomaricurvus sp. HS19]
MLKNISYLFIARFFVRILGLLSTLIVARLLVPEDYGLIATCMIVQDLAERMQKVGIGQNIITNQSLDRNFLGTAISLRIVIAIVFSVLVFLSADMAGEFFENSQVSSVLSVICWMFFIVSLSNPALILAARNEKFLPEIKCSLIGKLISTLSTIALAWYLENFWALAYGMVISAVAYLLLSYLVLESGMRLAFSRSSLKQMAGFSGWILVHSWVGWVNANLIKLVWGRVFGAHMLGLISMGGNLFSIFETEVSAAVEKANLSNLVRSLKIKDGASEGFAEIVRYNICALQDVRQILIIPAYIVLICCPKIIVSILLGDGWQQLAEFCPFIAVSIVSLSYSKSLTSVFVALRKPEILVVSAMVAGSVICLFGFLAYIQESYYFLLVSGMTAHILCYFYLCYRISGITNLAFWKFCRRIDIWQMAKVLVVFLFAVLIRPDELVFSLVVLPLVALAAVLEWRWFGNYLVDKAFDFIGSKRA